MLDVEQLIEGIKHQDNRSIAKAISLVENGAKEADRLLSSLDQSLIDKSVVLGITGAPGAGKSTLTDKLIRYCREQNKRVGVIAIDPTSPISGGAIHGDRIRMMQHALDVDVVVRSMATRGRLGGLCASAGAVMRIMASGGCDPVIIETVGVGQSEIDIIRIADITALVTAPGLGDDIQALKAGLLEVADIMIVNKADRPGAEMLAAELQEVAREKGRQVLMTIASEGTGIDELYKNMQQIFQKNKASGESTRRRKESRRMEIVDWCLEMMRAYLKKLEEIDKIEDVGDPRVQARNIVENLVRGKFSIDQE